MKNILKRQAQIFQIEEEKKPALKDVKFMIIQVAERCYYECLHKEIVKLLYFQEIWLWQ